MITAMYLRKSRAEENEPIEQTLSRHREALTALAREQRLSVVRCYEEVVSGDSLTARPQMLLLLEELDRYDAVLCMDIDRLGRGAMHEQGLILETFRQSHVLIITPGKTYDLENDLDDSLISFKALFAREEYKQIRGRLHRGVMKSVEEGCYIANAPFGYRKVRVNKKPTLEIDENEAEGVRMIFSLYLDGNGCQAVADTLHSLGFRPRRGDKFNRTTIAKIIRNPAYIGKVVWNQHSFARPKKAGQTHRKTLKPRDEWLIVDGLHHPIVTEEVFSQANERLRGRYHPPYRKADHLENPLAGVLFCVNCGKSIVRQPLYNKTHASPIMLCPTTGCCMSSNQDFVESLFFHMLESYLDEFKSASTSSLLPEAEDRGGRYKAEVTRLKVQLARLHDLLEQGLYDADTFLARRNELMKRLEIAHASAEKEKKPIDKSILAERLQTVLDQFWVGTPSERNRLIKSVVARAVYSKPKGSPWNSPPHIEIKEWRA